MLEGFHDEALADLGDHRLLDRDVPELPADVVRRLGFPDLQDHVDALDEHRIAILAEGAEDLGVRHQPTRADAHDQAALGQMVEHRDLPGDRRRVRIGQVEGAGAELDIAGFRNQAGQENHRRGDALGGIGDMLADECLRKSESIGQDDRLTILLQGLGNVAAGWVHRHHEHAVFHWELLCGSFCDVA